jgi:cyanuric acid amidohydrolase
MKAHRVLKVPMAGPDDLAEVCSALKRESISPERIKAVMCMTEGLGNGRGFATLAFSNFFHRELGWAVEEVPKRIPLIMIGGCSGFVAPYAALFVEDAALEGSAEEPRLAVGISSTADFDLEKFGTTDMVDEIAAAVRKTMASAGIEPKDVHNVQIKAPWPQSHELASAKEKGRKIVTLDTNRAGMLARGGAALGVGVALGEIDRKKLTDADIASNWSLWSDIASTSSGMERSNFAVLVIGNSRSSRSPFRIGHAALGDALDANGVYAALASAGIETDRPLAMGPQNPVDHAFLKSAADGTGSCRGRRHVLGTDFLGAYSWLIGKAVIHATVASIVGDPMMQVSGGGEHQGRPGGGHLAIIARA